MPSPSLKSPASVAGGVTSQVKLAAASQTVKASDTGSIFVGAVDAVFTLPSAASTPVGTAFTFVCGVASGGTGLSISPQAADGVYGAGLTGVIGKDLINSGASDVVGDLATVVCLGASGVAAWLITDKLGTWAKEA